MDAWIPYDDPNYNAWQCPRCGAVQYLEFGTPLENEWFYCPHCREPMKSGVDERHVEDENNEKKESEQDS